MANKIVRALLFLLLPATMQAATFPISPGASFSTIQSTITTAAQTGGANIVSFAAGTYTGSLPAQTGGINTLFTIPCPSGSLIITGPATIYGQRGVIGSINARPTAALVNNNTGGKVGMFFFFPTNCSGAITVQYLEIDGGHPYSGGGDFYGAGGNSNVTIAYNYVHGFQTYYPIVNGTSPNQSLDASSDNNASWLYFSGDQSSNVDTGNTITWNIIGNPANPGNNDCSNMMTWAGQNLNQGTSNQFFTGYDAGQGGACGAFWNYTSSTNLNYSNNNMENVEEGVKGVECPTCEQVNVNYNYNDFGWIHHSFIETQMHAGNYNLPWGMQYNSQHDPYVPAFANWNLSLAQNQYDTEYDNLIITNQSGANNMPPSFEWWGNGLNSNNLFQGQNTCAFTFNSVNAYDPPTYHASIFNNTFQLNDGNSPGDVCTFTDSGGHTAVGIQSEGEPGQTTANAPIITGNSYSTTIAPITSTAPTITPNGGSFSGSQVVTFHDPGNTGGVLPRGNTGIWYTLDGSTPSPRCGTCAYAADGDTATLTSTTTVKMVGMWGALNQPVSWPNTGHGQTGYTASSVVSATFTGGGTPTAAAPTFTPGTENITGAISVTLASSTPSPTIKYCLTSLCTPSTTYTSPISVSATTTITAFATASGFAQSPNSSATYTLVAPGAAATPTFSPAGQTYTNLIQVTIADATPGAIIYYTNDGSTPTTGSTVYTGVLTLNSTQTLKAIATASGFTTSAVGSATYTSALFLGNNQVDNTTSNTYPGSFNSLYAVTGTAAGGYTVTGCVVNQGTAPVTSGAHTDCILNLATSTTTQATTSLCHGTYTNTSSTPVAANITLSGCPTLPASTAYWVASITDDQAQPSGLGFWDCNNVSSGCTGSAPTLGTGTYPSFYVGGTYGSYGTMPTTLNKGLYQVTQYLTLTPATTTVATPVITPASGAITGATTISITDTTGGSSIYYTTDGTTPTTGSTPYTGTFTISATTTVKALAVKAGSNNSAIASNSYTLTTGSISSVFISTASLVNFVVPGVSDQLTVNVLYSDGTPTTIVRQGTTDTRGSTLTSIVSSNPAVATVSNSEVVTGVSNTVKPNWTLITATVTDSSGGTHTANWIEGVGNSLTSGIQGGGMVGSTQ